MSWSLRILSQRGDLMDMGNQREERPVHPSECLSNLTFHMCHFSLGPLSPTSF